MKQAMRCLALTGSFLLASCTTPSTSETTSPSSPTRTASGASTPPSPVELAPLTLTASLDEPPMDWTEVTFLPAGSADSEIGSYSCSDCELPDQPASALAVAKDGSFWIADPLKQRVAHFSSDGIFLSAIPVDRGPADVAFVGDRLYVLPEGGGAVIVGVKNGRLSEEIVVNDDGKRLHVQGLIGGQEELVTLIAGAERLLGGYWAMATVDRATGQASPSAGAQVSGSRFMDFEALVDDPDADYAIRWSDGQEISKQQVVRFQLTKSGRDLRTSVGGTYLRATTPTGFVTLVSLGGRQGLTVGRWFLEVPADGTQPTFERVPEEGFIGDALRYLAVDDDGTIYWMRLFDDGLHVYRRPTE